MALKVLLCFDNDELPQHRSVLRAIHTLNPPKNYIPKLGGCRPSICRAEAEREASWGALGGHFCLRQSWSAMVVLVNVGRWRLTSDQPTAGIVKNVYGRFFLFLGRSHTFLTSDLLVIQRRIRPLHFVV
jgi:hypothetical protein